MTWGSGPKDKNKNSRLFWKVKSIVLSSFYDKPANELTVSHKFCLFYHFICQLHHFFLFISAICVCGTSANAFRKKCSFNGTLEHTLLDCGTLLYSFSSLFFVVVRCTVSGNFILSFQLVRMEKMGQTESAQCALPNHCISHKLHFGNGIKLYVCCHKMHVASVIIM